MQASSVHFGNNTDKLLANCQVRELYNIMEMTWFLRLVRVTMK